MTEELVTEQNPYFKNFLPTERTAVYVDAANMYHSLKEADISIDFKRLKELLDTNMALRSLNYFVAINKQKSPSDGVVAYLETNGWRVYKKLANTALDKKTNTTYIRKGNIDVDLAVVMVDDIHCSRGNIEHVILFSGDKDYQEAVKILRRHARVTVISTRNHLARELKSVADEVIFLDDLEPYICYLNPKETDTCNEKTIQ